MCRPLLIVDTAILLERGDIQMAKGQQRSNKEKKKPKQSKKPGGPAVPFGSDKSKTPPLGK
jgi:hypothetical protein